MLTLLMPIRALNPGRFFKARHRTTVVYVVIRFSPLGFLQDQEFEISSVDGNKGTEPGPLFLRPGIELLLFML